MSANNSYTGITSIEAGTLVINGDQSAANGAMTVGDDNTANSSATLGGTGTVGGAITVRSDGIAGPGCDRAAPSPPPRLSP